MEKLWRCPIRGENWFLSVPSAGRVTGCTSRASGGRAYFYPRPPRGGRPQCISGQPETRRFLSTPSARRATTDAGGSTETGLFLSTPSARRATSGTAVLLHEAPDISIHALREEGDTLQSKSTERLFDFYPRPPRGGRRQRASKSRQRASISIHALREEGDLEKLLFCLADRLFLSTPSARRATQSGRPDRDRCVISIHALREEGDHRCRRRYSDRYRISIHALREEGDCIFWVGRRESMISIHALREEGDL